MKDRPILFSAPMVRAILGRSKTQTRRVVKPQPTQSTANPLYLDWKDGSFSKDEGMTRYAPYQPGMKLWVRETWGDGAENNVCSPTETMVFYRATDPGWDDNDTGFRWKPSIHMPRWASRITLEVVSVRVERLNDISEEDAIAEGVTPTMPNLDRLDHVDGFAHLWESINGKGSWQENPYVWVIEFKVVEE